LALEQIISRFVNSGTANGPEYRWRALKISWLILWLGF